MDHGTPKPSLIASRLMWVYLLLIHLLFVVMVVKTEFATGIARKFGYKQTELTPYILEAAAHHRRMDASVPDLSAIFIGDSITQGLATSASVYTVQNANERVDQLNKQLTAEAINRSNVQISDWGNILCNGNGSLSSQYHEGDGIHLNRAGYALMSRSLKSLVDPI